MGNKLGKNYSDTQKNLLQKVMPRIAKACKDEKLYDQTVDDMKKQLGTTK